ncbi:MAG: rhodanese-like domain-containing protein, partial [Herbaspirillum sp.]
MKSLVSKLFISAAATSALAFSYAAQAAAPLVTPAELQQLQATPVLRVIDIRPSKDYQAKHIPGAISAPYGEWRGSPTNPGDLPPLA